MQNEINNNVSELNLLNVNTAQSGDEIEREDETPSGIRPFDPSQIDISSSKITLDSIFKRLKNGEIKMDPEFQRRSDLWDIGKKSRLIESIILKIPLSAFYIDTTNDDNWLIIDGLQRISTLRGFAVEKTMKLEQMEFFDQYNGKGYDDLPRNLIRRIEETEINLFKVNPGTPDNVKYNIFKRINTGVLTLEPQEIRNAMFQGKAAAVTKEMSKDENFLNATDRRIGSDRMKDREFPTRFFAVCYLGIDKYEGVPDNYLNAAMERINQLSDNELSDVKKTFSEVMKICFAVFQHNTFRKIAEDGRRGRISTAVFEIWSRTVFLLSESDRRRIVERNDRISCEFKELCVKDTSFSTALKSSDKNNFAKRFEYADKIVNEVLKNA